MGHFVYQSKAPVFVKKLYYHKVSIIFVSLASWAILADFRKTQIFKEKKTLEAAFKEKKILEAAAGLAKP